MRCREAWDLEVEVRKGRWTKPKLINISTIGIDCLEVPEVGQGGQMRIDPLSDDVLHIGELEKATLSEDEERHIHHFVPRIVPEGGQLHL